MQADAIKDWARALAAVVYLSAMWGLWVLTEGRPTAVTRVAQVGGAAVGALALGIGVAASATEGLPNQRVSAAVVDVSAPLRAALDPEEPHAIQLRGTAFVAVGPSVQLDLERHGFDVCDADAGGGIAEALGPSRTCQAPPAGVIVVATDTASIASIRADPDHEVVADYSSLTPVESAELADLLGRIPADDLLWIGVALREGEEVAEPGPEAGYTVADVERVLELRAREIRLAVGVPRSAAAGTDPD